MKSKWESVRGGAEVYKSSDKHRQTRVMVLCPLLGGVVSAPVSWLFFDCGSLVCLVPIFHGIVAGTFLGFVAGLVITRARVGSRLFMEGVISLVLVPAPAFMLLIALVVMLIV